MATFQDAAQLVRAQRARADGLARKFKLEHREMANQLYEEAHHLLSGGTSQRTLTALGHPFGRRTVLNGQPGRQRRVKGLTSLLPALPINTQSGRLREALRLLQRNSGSKQVFLLQVSKSLAPYAKYVLNTSGTVKMVTRPFWAALQKSWRKKNFELLLKMRADQKRST